MRNLQWINLLEVILDLFGSKICTEIFNLPIERVINIKSNRPKKALGVVCDSRNYNLFVALDASLRIEFDRRARLPLYERLIMRRANLINNYEMKDDLKLWKCRNKMPKQNSIKTFVGNILHLVRWWLGFVNICVSFYYFLYCCFSWRHSLRLVFNFISHSPINSVFVNFVLLDKFA